MEMAWSTRWVTTPLPRPVTRPISGRGAASPVRTMFTMRRRLVASSGCAPKRNVDSFSMVDFRTSSALSRALWDIYSRRLNDLGNIQTQVRGATMPYGVGIIGAGPGVRALHAPTLARLPDDFALVHVSDSGSGRAEEIARPIGARWSVGIEELLGDPAVEVVAVCSPPALHAEQVLAAIDAGKRAVFCEKPLATNLDDAIRVVEACRAAAVPLLVGTNHLFDPSWGRVRHHLAAAGQVRAISVTVALPPNDRYHSLVTESRPSGGASRGAPDLGNPAIAASVVRQLLTGLAIHDLPLLRDLAPDFEDVVYARAVAPIGYAV